jgi:hypothetical protein
MALFRLMVACHRNYSVAVLQWQTSYSGVQIAGDCCRIDPDQISAIAHLKRWKWLLAILRLPSLSCRLLGLEKRATYVPKLLRYSGSL